MFVNFQFFDTLKSFFKFVLWSKVSRIFNCNWDQQTDWITDLLTDSLNDLRDQQTNWLEWITWSQTLVITAFHITHLHTIATLMISSIIWQHLKNAT